MAHPGLFFAGGKKTSPRPKGRKPGAECLDAVKAPLREVKREMAGYHLRCMMDRMPESSRNIHTANP